MTIKDLEIERWLSQAEQLAILVQTPQWATLRELLTSMRIGALEELATIADTGELRYWQGMAAGIGEILDRPDRVINWAAEYRDREEAEKGVIRTDIRALTSTLGDDI